MYYICLKSKSAYAYCVSLRTASFSTAYLYHSLTLTYVYDHTCIELEQTSSLFQHIERYGYFFLRLVYVILFTSFVSCQIWNRVCFQYSKRPAKKSHKNDTINTHNTHIVFSFFVDDHWILKMACVVHMFVVCVKEPNFMRLKIFGYFVFNACYKLQRSK